MNESRFRQDVKAQLDAMLLAIPGVKDSKAFSYPAYKICGKVFCFVGKNGIALKLPPSRTAELIARQGDMRTFRPKKNGMIWPSWVSIDHSDAAAYEADQILLRESLQFVLG